MEFMNTDIRGISNHPAFRVSGIKSIVMQCSKYQQMKLLNCHHQQHIVKLHAKL